MDTTMGPLTYVGQLLWRALITNVKWFCSNTIGDGIYIGVDEAGVDETEVDMNENGKYMHAVFLIWFLQALLDHKVYYMNLTDANLTNKPKWQVEYSAKVTA